MEIDAPPAGTTTGGSDSLPPYEQQKQIIEEIEKTHAMKAGDKWFIADARIGGSDGRGCCEFRCRFAGEDRYTYRSYFSSRVDQRTLLRKSVLTYHSVYLTDNSEILEDDGALSGPGNIDEPRLKENLQENLDYVLLPETMWRTLVGWYGGGPPVYRLVYERGTPPSAFVEVYPMTLQLHREGHLKEPSRSITISQMATVTELRKMACDEYGLDEESCSIWDYFQRSKYSKLDILETKSLEALKIMPNQDVLVQEKVGVAFAEESADVEEMATSPLTSFHSTPVHTYNSNSGRYNYYDSPQNDVTYSTDSEARKGRAGLGNLGNTCFMNSSLQCLSHTAALNDYFLSNEHLAEVNKDNPMGLGGELAIAYGSLMQALWKDSAASVHPRAFKGKLAQFAPQFSGYNQQDSQELLAFLLDGLHEDLNRVKQKPYMELKDAENRPLDEVAKEAWDYHLARNNSVIVDLFQGQYKSTLVCPSCGKQSVTFDPFMYLSLPLPTVARNVEITVITSDGSAPPTKYGVKVDKEQKVQDVLEELAKLLALRADERLLLAEVCNNFIFKFISESEKADRSLKDIEDYVAY
eukprot:gene20716-24826_t